MSGSLFERWKRYFDVSTIGGIRWAHAVNSKAQLDRVLETAHFIESDIYWDRKGNIIYAHPPRRKSDLDLHDLYQRAYHADARIGVKLDVKAPEILGFVLSRFSQYFHRPVIINADILTGNDGMVSPFNPRAFIDLCRDHLRYNPNTIISPGWTTTKGRPYTKENVDQMIKLCRGIKNITFPVRLSLLQPSWPQLQRLLAANKLWTLSVWSGTDYVTNEQNWWLARNNIGQRAFIDIG